MYANPEEKLWYVVKYYQGKSPYKGYRLEKNAIVKFGRVRLRVRDIDYKDTEGGDNTDLNQVQNGQIFQGRNSNAQRKMTQDEIGAGSIELNEIELQEKQNQQINNINQDGVGDKKNMPFEIVGAEKSKKDENGQLNLTQGSGQQCRICWGAEEEEESGKDFNPLISPCNCTGTVQAIHLKCLKEWLETKRTMKVHRGQVIIKFKKLDCELCKQVFPFQVTTNNRIVDIVEIEKPESDYIIFESLNSSSSKIFYIINTENKNQIRIGRGQESDVRITDDISVSRLHAIIRKTPKGDYQLEDYNSKFGTLIQVQYPVFLNQQLYGNQPLVFQSGKTCIFINVRQHVSCFPSCFKANKKEKHENLMSLDSKHFFPVDFMKSSLESNQMSNSKKNQKFKNMFGKAQVMKEDDVQEGEEQKIVADDGQEEEDGEGVQQLDNENNQEQQENNQQQQQDMRTERRGISNQNSPQVRQISPKKPSIDGQQQQSAINVLQQQITSPRDDDFETVRVANNNDNAMILEQNENSSQIILQQQQLPLQRVQPELNPKSSQKQGIIKIKRIGNGGGEKVDQDANEEEQQMPIKLNRMNILGVGQASGDNINVEEEKLEEDS